MGSVGSDTEEEDELRTCSKLKLPKRVFFVEECSTVCHVSVPRRLRSSATKKRSSESISQPLRVSNKLNRVADGDRLLHNDSLKKSKLKMKQVEVITKDEEEVAEALFALSGLISNNATTDENNLAGGGSGAKSSTLTKAEIFVPSVEARREGELQTVNDEDGDGKMPNIQSSATGSAGCGIPCLNDSDIPEVNLHFTAFTSENQQAVCDSASGVWSQLRKTRSKLTTLEKSLATYKSQEIVLPPIAEACDKTEDQQTNTKTRINGSPLMPDLSSAVLCEDSQRLSIPFQSHMSKLPAWIDNTSRSSKSSSLKTDVIAKKGAPFSTHSKKSYKRCTAHVYISHFIKAFQDRDVNNDRSMIQSTTINEVPIQRASRTETDQTRERNCLIEVISSDIFDVSPGKNATEVDNAILLHKKLVKDQQLASKPYDVFNAQNQSLGFLTMPAGGARMETGTGFNRARNSLEASISAPFPCLQSRNQVYVPFQVPQNHYSSTSSSGHCPMAPGLQVQLPPYFGSGSDAPPFTDANALSVQPLEQQNCNRPPPLSANFEPGAVVPSKLNKQPGRPGIPLFPQHQQTSLELLGSRYPLILQQHQQQLISAPSLLPSSISKGGLYHHLPSVYEANALLPSSTTKGPYHHLPSVFEANADRVVRPDNPSLQIICNQYI
ncbi:OLC1v1018224C1 [Oldenlandia corymbosa var. corymbosa]|uniref:OLC1v1018224C1 n=1 Tax=Oldenlandia corymbosa var. corymbosa TaxID=529605 RepID=A0AAV1EB51_OLDCO|nr:OLC1v1018224C1 [Oldenlandia corymbosa var. corymbosa]